MNKFIKGDRVWALAEVLHDQDAEDMITIGIIMPSGNVSTMRDYADAHKARMETPRVDAGMWVSIGMLPHEVIARHGDYLWCRRQSGQMETVHISAVTARRDDPRSTEPVEEPDEMPPETPPAGNTTAPGNDKHGWWKEVDSYPVRHQMTRDEFAQTFPEATFITSGSGFMMVTPKGYWRLPAGVGTVWTYNEDIPF